MLEEVPGVIVEFPSYIDDLYWGLHDARRIVRGLYEVEWRERMEQDLDRVSTVLKEVGMEWNLPLVEDKKERLILCSKSGRRGRGGMAEKVKSLGVVLVDELDFGKHWEYRIQKARSLFEALDGVRYSKWGMSPLSWRQADTGMIRSVASWGLELGWRGQRDWRTIMEKLQYTALRTCTWAVSGARNEAV